VRGQVGNQIVPRLDAEHFDFSSIEAAYLRVGQGQPNGKVIIDIGGTK
jgi:hypothetical protein